MFQCVDKERLEYIRSQLQQGNTPYLDDIDDDTLLDVVLNLQQKGDTELSDALEIVFCKRTLAWINAGGLSPH